MPLVRSLFSTAAIAVLSAVAGAQDSPRDPHDAQPERPTVATHAGTVSPGWIEFESGIEFDHGSSPHHAAIGTLVTKIGIGSRAQLSLFTNALASSDAAGGFGDLGIGVKLRLAEHNPWLGDFAIQPTLKLPTGSLVRGSGTGTTDASLLLISSRDIGALHIDLNIGWTHRDGSGVNAPSDASVWTASFSGPLAGPLQWTAELYGYPGTGGEQGALPIVAVLAGPTYAVAKWLVIDAGTIVPVAGAQPRAVYAGVTWNAGRIW